jgi:beta-galactosidase
MKAAGQRWGIILGVSALMPVFLFGQREVRDFNRDWRFLRGDQPAAAAQLSFNDSSWQAVRLPHDWAISGPFDEKLSGNTGKLPWQGVGWYRKVFTPAGKAGQRVYFDFDGVMAFPKVYVNGQLAGEWDYGYMSFRVDATRHIRFGERNVIAVQVDTRKHQSRWYPGAGIYRKVTMTVTDPVHIAHWGTFVTTPAVSDSRATVRVQTSVENHGAAEQNVTVEVALFDPSGKKVGSGSKNGTVSANGTVTVDQQLLLANPQRWDFGKPNLYQAVATLRNGAAAVDQEQVTFGVRTLQFTANDGFYLNGKRVQLKGVNLHHDLGALGAAFNVRAMQRQLEIMQDMGVNALRTSHNAPAPEVLELCDRMGIFVWDEAFDKWNGTADNLKGPEGILPHAERQLVNLVQRDRNHPSVFVWSVGNEIGTSVDERGDGMSFGRLAAMREVVLKHDATRPVGIGCHTPNTVSQAVYDPLDLTGWNYGRRYDRYREMYPDKPILYSESASTVSTRGFYALPLAVGKTAYPGGTTYVDSYDMSAAPWSDIPDFEFNLMEKDRFVAGEFVWTGFDYLGEPTPNERDARSSYFGIVDLAGIPKDRYYLYRSLWRPEETTIHILPHWNWPDRVGKNVPVFVYTNGDSAELFLNGKSLGRRTKGVVPPKPPNLARGKAVTASSGANAGQAVDGDGSTQWQATSGGQSWLQVDLGGEQRVGHILVSVGQTATGAAYQVKLSSDGQAWKEMGGVAARAGSGRRSFGGFGNPSPAPASFELEAQARYIRIEFPPAANNAAASLRELSVYSSHYEPEYYDVTYNYRLRWNDVPYQPGELKAVAYRGAVKLGEKVLRTAGPPATIRLTPDRTALSATGEDLSFVLVEALDAKGEPAPLADNLVQFEVEGPGEIAGIDNGDQISLVPFQSPTHQLFYGKAMLIVRTVDGRAGKIQVKAQSAGLSPADVTLTTTLK